MSSDMSPPILQHSYNYGSERGNKNVPHSGMTNLNTFVHVLAPAILLVLFVIIFLIPTCNTQTMTVRQMNGISELA